MPAIEGFSQDSNRRERALDRLSPMRALAVILLGVAVLGLIVGQLVSPVRQTVSRRYLERGDIRFLELNYPLAVKEYQAAINLDGNNQQARARLLMAKQVTVDPKVAVPFFSEKNSQAWLDQLTAATTAHTQPKLALQAGVKLYSAKKYALARYALEEAVALDSEYAEGWHYLGLDYAQLAQFDQSYQTKADEALAKRDQLSPGWEE